MATPAHRWSPRWWHWLLFALVFLPLMVFAVLLALRTAGRADYQRVIADLQAKGTVATVDEFIARTPVVDVALQEEWHQWSQRGIEYPPSTTFDGLTSDFWLRYVYGEAPLPPEVLQNFADHRVPMQAARDLLQDSRLLVSAYGHLAHDFPPGKRTAQLVAAIRIPNLLATRSLARWLQHAACIEADPQKALDDFDRYYRALSRPACLIDAMIWDAIAGIRNETYLHLALLGRLPEVNRAAWLAEDCHLIAGIADGFEGERALFDDAWAQTGEETSFIGSFTLMDHFLTGAPASTSWWDTLDPQRLYGGPWIWATIHYDSAISAELLSHVSARLRSERTDPIPDWTLIAPRYRGYGAIAMSNLLECGKTALESEARHRMHQIAVMLLVDAAAMRGLPADAVELATRLGSSARMTPTGDRLHLTYERLSPERFRLMVSPTSPVPNFDAPGRQSARTRAFGSPPGKGLLVSHPHLEIQLPSRLRPAP